MLTIQERISELKHMAMLVCGDMNKVQVMILTFFNWDFETVGLEEDHRKIF